MRRPALAILCATMLLSTSGCFEKEEPTCAYWVPKLDSPAKSDKAWEQVEELKCVDAIPYLEKMFDDGRDRERILRSLTLIGDKAASASIMKKAVMTRDAGKLAASIIEDWRLSQARPALEAILTGDTLPKHREVALEALLSFEKPENIEDLLITLANGDPNVQGVGANRVAVEQLGAMKSEKAIPTLIKAAFMRDNRGAKIYQAARLALAQVGPKVVEPLIATIEGKNEELKTYARDQGIQPWEWQLGPEIVQIVTDTLDGRIGPSMVANANIELNPPMGISEAMSEKWRVAQMNRLKVGMLGMGHAGPSDEKTVAALIEVVKDPLKDAINQRLNSATTLAMIGTSTAQDALLKIYDDEVDTRFCAPMLQPIALGLDSEHMKAFQKVTKKISKLEEESLRGPTVSAYLAAVHECKDDATCYLKKLESDDLQSSDEKKLAFAKHQAVKSAVMLARGLGDPATVRAGLLKAFSNMPENSIDLRRFTLIALTRVGDATTGQQLLDLAENADNKKGFWPSELLIYGNSLKHRK